MVHPKLQLLALRAQKRTFALTAIEAMGRPPLMHDDADTTTTGIRTVEVGLDPVRILLFGAGIAVGWGVQQREEAMDRPLAAAIASRTGRGVVIENRAVQHLLLRNTIESLGGAGAHTFHVAVWCPAFMEGFDHLNTRGWFVALDRMIGELREESAVPLIVVCLGSPTGRPLNVVLARPFIAAVNRSIRQAASRHADVRVVEPEPIVLGEASERSVDAVHYRRNARRIAAGVLAQLGFEAERATRSSRLARVG